jgi:hypothetical protein
MPKKDMTEGSVGNWNETIQQLNKEMEKTEQKITDEVHTVNLSPETIIDLAKRVYMIPPKANIINAYTTNQGVVVLYNLKRV